MERRYGWKRDTPDFRDLRYSPRVASLTVPSFVDLSDKMPLAFDQGELGSCTGQAAAALHRFEQSRQGDTSPIDPSRLFIYYCTRSLEGTVNSDAGASIRATIKALAQFGVCPEDQWEYDVTRFRMKPPANAFDRALKHQALRYQRVNQTLGDMKSCLASNHPFEFGFQVYESFESDAVKRTGLMPMPSNRERALGGHAVIAIGYDDRASAFLCRNSWGANWGLKGNFWMPYEFIINPNLAADFWMLQEVELGDPDPAPVPVPSDVEIVLATESVVGGRKGRIVFQPSV